MKNAKIKSEVECLADVLRGGTFFIPRYQRPYAWMENHIRSLLDDLAYCISRKQPHHFLGTIMLISKKGKEERQEINDGQQRITTFLLICAYLCRFFRDHGYSSGENQVLRLLFDISEGHGYSLSDADALSPRVVLSTNDKKTFEFLTCGHAVKKNGQMYHAWQTIHAFFAGKEYASLEAKKKFLDCLLNKVLVAWIQFEDAVDSIAVFETLNTRGKSLEQIQLACTYFYSCLRGDEIQSVRMHEQIDSIRTNLRNDEGVFFDYARCLAQCKYGHLSSDRFCRDIKQAIAQKPPQAAVKEVCELVGNLSERHKIQIFQTLKNLNSEEIFLRQLTTDARKNNSTRKIADYLKDMHMYSSVSNPIMFSLLCRYAEISDPAKKREAAKFVYESSKLLSSFFQRAAHSFTGSFSPSKYEKGVSDLAMKIAGEHCNTAPNFLSVLRELDRHENIISDSQYKERMRSISFPGKVGNIKYVLARINEHFHKDLSVVEAKATTEHILPESKMHLAGWDFTDDEHARYAHRFGNMTLLAFRDNKPKGEDNANFAVKREIYAKSSYEISQKLADLVKWDAEAVEKRQAELAKIAALIWNFKVD